MGFLLGLFAAASLIAAWAHVRRVRQLPPPAPPMYLPGDFVWVPDNATGRVMGVVRDVSECGYGVTVNVGPGVDVDVHANLLRPASD